MKNTILTKIQEHLTFLEASYLSTIRIYEFTKEEQLDELNDEIDNRIRIVNIVSSKQSEIEILLDNLDSNDFSQEDMIILKSWFSDLTIFSEKILDYDNQILLILNEQKDETTKEISHIFKNKELFKGYNQQVKK